MKKSAIRCIIVSLLFFQAINAREKSFDASSIEWKLWGYRPDVWRMNFDFDRLTGNWAEYFGINIEVPGSVQLALKKAGIIEDWNIGLNSTKIEWIENRHWLIAGRIPDNWVSDNQSKTILKCKGLDYKGMVMINGKDAGRFENAFIPCEFDISKHLKKSDNTIVFVFECPPENLAQVCWTSQIKDWKPRFNYGWDWVPRIVQTGIWDKVYIHVEKNNPVALEYLQIIASADKKRNSGRLSIKAHPGTLALKGQVKIELTGPDGKKILDENFPAREVSSTKIWDKLDVKRWFPNGFGEQPLYSLKLALFDENGIVAQSFGKKVGFRYLEWLPCEGAVAEAEPWICSINNQPFFIQGINWTPIRPNFADLQLEDYRKRLKLYQDMGINTIRIWGGGFPEKDWLYDLCDELGILVWQDFPLSSSGLDNYPPEGEKEIHTITQIVKHYVSRLHHHACIMLWCAGNELYEMGDTAPVTDRHPMISSIKDAVLSLDPSRKFVPGAPSGPSIYASYTNFGKGINWDVHGPWDMPFTEHDKSINAVRDYWSKCDALMHSEVGVPGAMSVEMMKKYRGEYQILPASVENPIWRTVNWWIQWDEYLATKKDAENLDDYVIWSQERQSEGLSIAAKTSKDRFPACGGFIIWMGHDSFPCMINTSIVDFEGNPKPVAEKLTKIFKDKSYLKNK